MTDPVHRPAHYTRGSIEVRDFVADQELNFNRGSAVKYICRAGYKDPSREVEDLEKAISCIRHEIARINSLTADSPPHPPQASQSQRGPAGGEAGPIHWPTFARELSAELQDVAAERDELRARLDAPAFDVSDEGGE